MIRFPNRRERIPAFAGIWNSAACAAGELARIVPVSI
jgi:hypothetical protein